MLIQNKLDEAKTNRNQFTLIWIPRHTDIIGNETADKLAKIAAYDTGTNALDLHPYDDFKTPQKTKFKKNGKSYRKTKPLN